MAFQPAVLEGGYVTDILLTIIFDGEAWDDAHLGTIASRFLWLFCLYAWFCETSMLYVRMHRRLRREAAVFTRGVYFSQH